MYIGYLDSGQNDEVKGSQSLVFIGLLGNISASFQQVNARVPTQTEKQQGFLITSLPTTKFLSSDSHTPCEAAALVFSLGTNPHGCRQGFMVQGQCL